MIGIFYKVIKIIFWFYTLRKKEIGDALQTEALLVGYFMGDVLLDADLLGGILLPGDLLWDIFFAVDLI